MHRYQSATAMKTIKIIYTLLIVIFGQSLLKAQEYTTTINGPATVNVFQNAQFTSSYTTTDVDLATWTPEAATVISSSDFSITLQWSSPGSYLVEYDLYTLDGSHYYGSKTVNVVSNGPSAPVATAATSVGTNSFNANWNSVSGATGYRLDVSTHNSFDTFVSGYNNLSVTATNKSISGLAQGAPYYYRVRAVNSSGTSVNSNTISVTTSGPPGAPVASSATNVMTTSFRANWGIVLGATNYLLYVSDQQDFSTFAPGYNGTTITVNYPTVTNLTPNKTYFYKVKAVNSVGSSTESNAITVTTAIQPAAPYIQSPTSVTTTSFTFSWNSITGATGYLLDVSLDNFSTFLPNYNSTTVSTTSKTVTGLTPGLTYYYRVRTATAVGPSDYSNTRVVTTTLAVPPAPEALEATNLSSTSFTANWTSIANATGYRLDVSTTSDFSTFVTVYNNLPITGTTRNVTGLTLKTIYYYRVRAVNTAGTSANSNTRLAMNLDKNYIISRDIQIPELTTLPQVDATNQVNKLTTYNFFDGLGRPEQSVTQQGSPLQKDIVQLMAYDQYGRETVGYLPYVSSGTDGWFKNFADKDNSEYTTSEQYQFYQNAANVAHDAKPYAETRFEPSPLNRVIKQGAPGTPWQPDATNTYASTDYTIKASYESNAANEVLLWTHSLPTASYPLGLVNASTGATPVYYPENQLYKRKTKDEQQHEVIEFKDLLGRVILKKVQASGSEWAETYYVYDDFNNLVTVLPPEAVKAIKKTPTSEYFNQTDVVKNDFLKRWAFRYTYDYRNRMTLKQVPGAEVVYMVYDKRDRLVLMQNGNQRTDSNGGITKKEWTFTKYDILNRPIITGVYTHSVVLDQASMQTLVDGQMVSGNQFYEDFNGVAATEGYTNRVFPTSSIDLLTVTYYDNYNFKALWSGNYDYVNDGLSYTVNSTPYIQRTTEFAQVKGRVTGTKVKVLDGGLFGGKTWLRSINYYDDKYQAIQTISDNITGGEDRVSTLYDFTGKPIKALTTHRNGTVHWKDQVAFNATGYKIHSTSPTSAWGSSGAASEEILPAGQDGWMECTVSETNLHRMIGFSDNNTNAHFSTIDYAFYLNATSLKIYENGSLKATINGALTTGDVLRMERIGTTIYYKRNGITVGTSTVPSTTQLMVDVALHSANSSVYNVHTSFSGEEMQVRRRYVYDHAGRMTETWHQLNSDPEVRIIYNEYNELGQLIDKKLHSSQASAADAKQSIDYRYNIRGWLTKINQSDVTTAQSGDLKKDLFGMELAYNNDLGTGNANANPALDLRQYNGNISAIKWSVDQGYGPVKEMAYNFSYDPMNRLLNASHKQSTTSSVWVTGQFDEGSLQYDLNGNIKALQRHGDNGALIDDLTYNYGTTTTASNKLVYIQDNTADPTAKQKGFYDGNPGTNVDYAYDANGNMIRDLNKGLGISLSDGTIPIKYNLLNLPERILKGNNNIYYIYDATGRKLSQIAIFGNTSVKQTDYAGEFIYENNELQFINHEEGRVVMSGNEVVKKDKGEFTTNYTTVNTTTSTATINGETYVKATSLGGVAKSGVYPIGGTIPVQAGERYKIRFKGYRDKGTYTSSANAFIIIQAGTTDLAWPGSLIPPNAVTESWIEQIVTIPQGVTTLKAGVAWNGAAGAGEVIYVNDFEVIRLTNGQPEYQYHLKDHLGNVRLTFTTKEEQDQYLATMETENAAQEDADFLNIAPRVPFASANHTPSGNEVVRLNNTRITGPAKSLAVAPGDVIDLEAYAYYEGGSGYSSTANLTTMIAAVTSAFGVAPGGGESGRIYNALNSGMTTAGLGGSSSDDVPAAYLNYILFDKDYNYITAGFKPVTSSANFNKQKLYFDPITIAQQGYIYIYVSNESNTANWVYFDDLKIIHKKSLVVQTNDYYPFGLAFNSYSRENSAPNQYLFNGKELQDELELDWLDYGARMYMSDIGRWGVIDPLSEVMIGESPYVYVNNDPALVSDPSGMIGESSNGFASTFIDPNGKVILHRDDDDNNVYLVNDPENWNGTKDGLPIVGKEDPDKTYKVGDQYSYYSSKNDSHDQASLINYLSNVTTTSLSMVAGNRANEMLDDMAVNFVPVWDETGKVIALVAKGKGALVYKSIRYVKGTLEFLGPLGDVVLTIHNVNLYREGKMGGGRLTYNLLGTGTGLYASYAAGGPAGILVGTLFLCGEAAYDSIQNLKAIQDRNRTPENTITSWDQLKRKLNATWDLRSIIGH